MLDDAARVAAPASRWRVAAPAPRRQRRRRRRRCCARLRGRRDQLRPGARSATCIRAPSRRTSSKRLLPLRPPGAAGQDQAADGRRHARGLGRLPHLDRQAHARHLLRRRPGLQGQAARAGRAATTSMRSSASPTRPNKSPVVRPARVEDGIRRPGRPARGGAATARSRSTTTREIEGLRALDRYTLQFKLAEPRPRFARDAAPPATCGAVAREVVEFYGDDIDGAPGGHRPVRLRSGGAARSSCSSATPSSASCSTTPSRAADDAEGQALLARFKGRRLPMIDRVEISIIEEEPAALAGVPQRRDRPRVRVPARRSRPQAMPNGKLAPNLAKRGIAAAPLVNAD